MSKKIMVSLALTISILAFPVRLFASNGYEEALFKACKGLIFITIIFLLMRRENILSKKLTGKKISPNVLLNLLPSLILSLLYLILNGFKQFKAYDGSTSLLVLTLLATFIAASAEEVIFRGYILNLLRKRKRSFYKSLLISSILFSLIHIINIFKYEDLWGVFNQIIFAFAIGMLLGSMYILTNNLMFVCIFHFIINVPSAVRSLNPTSELDMALMNSSLSENLLSTIFIIALMLPFLMLAFYYIKLIKNNEKQIQESQLSVVD